MPDTTLPPPLTLKDIEKPAAQAAPASIAKDEPRQTVTTPAAEIGQGSAGGLPVAKLATSSVN